MLIPTIKRHLTNNVKNCSMLRENGGGRKTYQMSQKNTEKVLVRVRTESPPEN